MKWEPTLRRKHMYEKKEKRPWWRGLVKVCGLISGSDRKKCSIQDWILSLTMWQSNSMYLVLSWKIVLAVECNVIILCK